MARFPCKNGTGVFHKLRPLEWQNSSQRVCIIVYDGGFGAGDVSEALTVKVDGTIHLKGQTGPDT